MHVYVLHQKLTLAFNTICKSGKCKKLQQQQKHTQQSITTKTLSHLVPGEQQHLTCLQEGKDKHFGWLYK